MKASVHLSQAVALEVNAPTERCICMLPPTAPGRIWTRDLYRVILYYGSLRKAAMQGGYILKTPLSNRSSVPVESANAATEGPRLPRGGSTPRSTINIDKSLGALSLAGIQSEAGTETTTAFNAIRADRLEAAVDDYEGNETSGDAGFELYMIIDSNRVSITKALCWTCRGAGHTKLECPSADVPRTIESVRAMLDAGIDRKNRTGRGGGRGGGERRPGRGQSAPFRAGGGFSGRRSKPPARR